MSLSSTSAPTASVPSPVIANSLLDDAASIWKDVQQALSLPACIPFTIQPLIITLRHLLLTNDPPSSQDPAIILECIRLIDDDVAQLDATIAAASTVVPHISTTPLQSPSIDKQKAQRAALQHVRERVQCVDSAVRQVPPEIWQQIFLFVQPSHFSENGMSVFDRRDPVYRIGEVCRKWRHLSHHCPRLWSRFFVHRGKVSSVSYGVSHLRTVLERSCSVPLDFTFRCGRSPRDEDREVPTELLSLLMQYSARWRDAKFMGMSLAEVLLLEDVRGRIPQLRSVKLDLYLENVGFERTDMVSAFEIAPVLSHVDLCGIPLGQVLMDPRAKQNLRDLHIEHYAGEEQLMYSGRTPTLSNILHAYPKLTSITLYCISFFDVITWPAPLPPGTPRSVYPDLKSLTVSDGGSIKHVSLPNLTHLDAGLDGEAFVQGLFPRVVSLLQHSRCPLSSLRLRSAEWDEDSMGMLLSLVPDLETLSISSGELPGFTNMMYVLTRFLGELDGARPKYAPRLKTLYIHLSATRGWVPMWAFLSRVFLDMVAVRAEYGALEVVKMRGQSVNMFPLSWFDDWERWDDMRSRGLIDVLVSVWN